MSVFSLEGYDVLSVVLLFLLGVVVGVLNVVAAGGSFLTLPVLILLGLSPSVANGTNRVAIFLQNLTAVWGFHRSAVIQWSVVGWFVGPALMGAPLGTWLALKLPDAAFQKVLAFLMVGITLMTLRAPSGVPNQPVHHSLVSHRFVTGAGFFLIGVYGGFVQAGVGFLLLAMTNYIGLDLVRGNGVKVLTVMMFTVLSLGLFLWQDKVHWGYGCILGAGSALGAVLGVRLSIGRGHDWIRRVVVVMVIGFAIHLWLKA